MADMIYTCVTLKSPPERLWRAIAEELGGYVVDGPDEDGVFSSAGWVEGGVDNEDLCELITAGVAAGVEANGWHAPHEFGDGVYVEWRTDRGRVRNCDANGTVVFDASLVDLLRQADVTDLAGARAAIVAAFEPLPWTEGVTVDESALVLPGDDEGRQLTVSDAETLDRLAELFRTPEWTQGVVEAACRLTGRVRPIDGWVNQFTEHGEDRLAKPVFPVEPDLSWEHDEYEFDLEEYERDLENWKGLWGEFGDPDLSKVIPGTRDSDVR